MVARRPRGRPPHPDVLTPAEWWLLHWIRPGLSRRGVADRLGNSENAVNHHLANLLVKLGGSGMAELRRWPRPRVEHPDHGRPSRPGAGGAES
jgi:DNA-binding NarL/FixJ family response regulator